MPGYWNSTALCDESALFIRQEGADNARVSLWFDPLEVVSVTSSSGEARYAAGRDYALVPGTNLLSAPPGSAIPVKRAAELTAPVGSQPYDLRRRDGLVEILFGAGHEYHDMQVLVTYTHAADQWRGPVPRFAGERLPKALRRLRASEPLKLVLFGDSISAGCNASKWAGAPPFRPFYGEAFADNLRAAYGSAVALTNLSVGGTTSAWGAHEIGQVIAEQPDLVVLAFGMNDSTGGCPVGEYTGNLQAQMAAVRGARPEAEFILVASMLPNPDWHVSDIPRLFEYRDALLALGSADDGAGVAVADLTSVWAELHQRKDPLSITGNGVNHPNDFGHALYAQVVSALLIE
jgi:lysophospholipase L1-like esterase